MDVGSDKTANSSTDRLQEPKEIKCALYTSTRDVGTKHVARGIKTTSNNDPGATFAERYRQESSRKV